MSWSAVFLMLMGAVFIFSIVMGWPREPRDELVDDQPVEKPE